MKIQKQCSTELKKLEREKDVIKLLRLNIRIQKKGSVDSDEGTWTTNRYSVAKMGRRNYRTSNKAEFINFRST